MLILFFNFILSKTYIRFDERITRGTIEFFFGPLDEIEFDVDSGYGSFFDDWTEYLYLYVDTGTRYGPFDHESGLAGVFFKNRGYSLIMINDGLENISFLVNVNTRYPSDFPVSQIYAPNERIENLTSPFIYYMDKPGLKKVVIIMMVILGILSFGPFIFLRCC